MAPDRKAEAAVREDSYATLIDLTKCDGCVNRDSQKCVTACKQENAHKFPEPDPEKIKDYWPKKMHEDWSGKRDVTNRLTPYNWTFVQSLDVEHEGRTEKVHVPRRCMHCDNPACVKLCPFGSNKKDTMGPVHIDPSTCFGGAKCRTVCPWDVPQRQAGVGIYTYLQPLPVGGGVMYKCDLCRDRLAEGKVPACVDACPNDAITISSRAKIHKLADELKAKYGGHIYGKDENGGTSTIYVSKVPFEKIDKAIAEQAQAANAKAEKAAIEKTGSKPKKKIAPMRMNKVGSKLEEKEELAVAALLAPFAGIAGAFAVTVAAKDKKDKQEDDADGKE